MIYGNLLFIVLRQNNVNFKNQINYLFILEELTYLISS